MHVRQAEQSASQEDGDVAHATAAERLASAAELTVNVSYQQMVVTLSQAPLQTLSDAIEVLQHAREQRWPGRSLRDRIFGLSAVWLSGGRRIVSEHFSEGIG